MAKEFKDLIGILMEIPEEYYQETFDKLTEIKHNTIKDSETSRENLFNTGKYTPEENLEAARVIFHEVFGSDPF